MKKNKKIISIILTSLMIFSIVATSLVPTISAHAQNMGSFVDKYGLTTDDILSSSSINADLDNPLSSGELRMFVPNKPYGNLYDKSSAVANCLDSIYLDFDNEVSYDDSLFLSLSLTNDYLTTFVFPQGSFLNCNYSTVDICIPVSTGVNTIYGSTWNTYSNVFDNGSISLNDNNHQGHITVDNVEYYVIENVWSENWVYIYLCNAPIYSFENINNVTTLDGAQQINNTNAYNNASNSQKKEDILANLSLYDNTKFYLSNSSFNTGSLYLYPVFNQSQISEDKNYAYFLRLVGTATYTCTYNSLSTNDASSNAITNYFPMSTSGNNPYDFTLKNGNDFSYDIPVSEVLNGSWSMDLSTLNGYFYNNKTENNLSVLANAFDNTFSGYSVFDTTDSVLAGLGFKYRTATLDLSKVKISEFNIVPTSAHYHIDLYVGKKSLTTDDVYVGNVQSYVDCDFVSGSVTSDNVNTSSYDDVKNALGSSSIPSSYAPVETSTNYGGTSSSVGGGSSSSDNNSNISGGNSNSNIGEGAIVINNNPTFNNDVSSSAASESKTSGFGSFLSTLISLVANGKTSSVETISSISGSTGYTNLVNTYLSTVPTSLWNTIIVTMTALLGISIIGFIVGLLFKIFF